MIISCQHGWVFLLTTFLVNLHSLLLFFLSRWSGLCLNLGMCSGMALYRNNGELFTERRGVIDAVLSFLGTSDHGSRVLRRGRRFGRITKHRLSRWVFVLTTLFSICLTLYGLKMFYQGKARETRAFLPDIFVRFYTYSFLLWVMCQKIRLAGFSLVFLPLILLQLKWNLGSQFIMISKKNIISKKILLHLMLESHLKASVESVSHFLKPRLSLYLDIWI